MEHILAYTTSDSPCEDDSPDPGEFEHTNIAPISAPETISGERSKKRPSRDPHRYSECVKKERKEEVSHQGRIRSFPHVEGHFATHVYFEVYFPKDGAVAEYMSRFMQIFDAGDQKFYRIDPPLHVSLSRTAAIKSVQIRSLLSGLQQALKSILVTPRRKKEKCVNNSYNGLDIQIGKSSDILVNDEKTRTFLSLSVSVKGTNDCTLLEQIVVKVSNIFKLHGLPEYYDDPKIHASIGWCLGNQEGYMQHLLQSPDAQRYLQRVGWNEHVTRILCRIGKKEHVVWSSVYH